MPGPGLPDGFAGSPLSNKATKYFGRRFPTQKDSVSRLDFLGRITGNNKIMGKTDFRIFLEFLWNL